MESETFQGTVGRRVNSCPSYAASASGLNFRDVNGHDIEPVRRDDLKTPAIVPKWLNTPRILEGVCALLFVPKSICNWKAGTTLVKIAEAEAGDRGCLGVLVDTFGFQATLYYLSLGYSLLARLLDYPPGP